MLDFQAYFCLTIYFFVSNDLQPLFQTPPITDVMFIYLAAINIL